MRGWYVSHLVSIAANLRRALVAKMTPHTRKTRTSGRVLRNEKHGLVMELISTVETAGEKMFQTLSGTHISTCSNFSRRASVMINTTPSYKEADEQSLYLPHTSHKLQSLTNASILQGVASGYTYLHSQDLTTKRVLLDPDLKAKIADFENV